MSKLRFFNTRLRAALFFLTIPLSSASACTDVRVVAEDNSVVSARSMEFGAALDSRLVVRPRGSQLVSPAPGSAKGLSWAVKYGYVYLDGFHLDIITDGLNEVGLGFGALYLPGFAVYETIPTAENGKAVSNLEIGHGCCPSSLPSTRLRQHSPAFMSGETS